MLGRIFFFSNYPSTKNDCEKGTPMTTRKEISICALLQSYQDDFTKKLGRNILAKLTLLERERIQIPEMQILCPLPSLY